MDKLIVGLATLGPIGKKLPAPGTFGSLTGLAVFGILMATQMSDNSMTIHCGFAILALLSIPICGQAERILDKEDPQEVILDEFVAQPLVFIGTPLSFGQDSILPSLLMLACGFALFRFFDILKPIGISRLQKLPGGLGVVADDVAAAGAAGLCLWCVSGTFPLSFP
ncbi:MAG: phosphatidylglycerophosphatase A [Opitutae bacterium]|jgi:phosphatidylglycerophosphatase A|nr:phosphatidylglycerophosphatase A [Opitutae bacterium]